LTGTNLNDIDSSEGLLKLRESIRDVLAGDAILFLGAGAAKDASTKNGELLPTGKELADFLASECGLGEGYPLDSIADHFIDEKSETALINKLRKKLNVSKVGGATIALAGLPWLRIWTTNYDDSFEKALDENKKTHFALTTSDDVHNAQGNKLIVLHINGYLNRIKQSLTKDFVLTSQSYATQTFVDSEWSTIFRNDIQQCKSVIFIGYSLADIDVARLIFSPETFHKKTHFIDHIKIDPVLSSKLSKFGTVHPIGLEDFSSIISEEKASWVMPELVEEYKSWHKLEISGTLRKPTDDDFYDLILQGVTKDGLILNQLNTPDDPSYTVVRDSEELCIKHLSKDDAVAILTGSFANGKTTTIRSISLKLVAEGRDVFYLDHPYESAFVELQKLCRRDSDFILVLENYSRKLKFIEYFCRYARPDCALLLSERTEIHELSSAALIDRIKHRELRIYELDLLENNEIDRMSALLDLRGLWGDRAGLSQIQKSAYLKEECGRQMQAILIEIAKSPQVKKRLDKIVTHFEAIDGGLRILICFCLLQAIGEEPRIDVAAELLELSYDEFKKLNKDEVTRQIVAVNSGVAQFRSPVISSAVLKGLSSASVVTEIVSDCVINGHLARHADKYLGLISKELVRFGNLEKILPSKGKRIALQNLYETLKTVQSIRNNPHFWLQYAMARLSLGELEIARRYFEQSYSYAKKINGYDTFQIDNHYCRLLLREAEDAIDSDEAFKAVDSALSTLKKQVLRENRHYPYRSAWSLEGVVKRHESNWTDAQKKSIVSSSRYLQDAANRLDAQVARSVSVVGGLQRLQRVIDVLT